MDIENKKIYYISSIEEAYQRQDYKGVIALWDRLMDEKVSSPCGFEPNADLIQAVRNRVVNIILNTAKTLNI